jgi:short-subunit dehydrogenase
VTGAVFITGAARGIGAQLARRLAARGARVALAGREPERLEALAAELGPGHAWFSCDVTDQSSLARAVEGTVAALGGIDVVVANAGIASFGSASVAPIEAQARVIEVNLTGVLRTVAATLPQVIARRGHYLLISSASALAPAPGLAAYAASKAAVEQLGNVLRLELAARGVSVGVAYPGWIDTDLVRDVREDLRSFREMIRRLPGPFRVTTSLERCAEVLARAVETRRRRVYVPRSLALAPLLRPFLMSALADRILLRQVGDLLPQVDAEVIALGRVFGRNSVEAASARATGAPS